MHKDPLVSIFTITYNHVSYIKQALDSFLSQETSFDYEIIVCDDFSTDGTREILKDYAQKHSNIILSLQPKNRGIPKNTMDGLAKIRGKYVAYCEGDDYWTSPHKLEKQVRFLEENPDFSVSCHKVEMGFEGNQPYTHRNQDAKPVYIYKDLNMDEERIKEGIFYADESIANYFFQTSSMVFRWRFKEGFPNWFTPMMTFDHYIFMLHAVEGKIKYFDESMSVWRRHIGGYTWLQNLNKGLFFNKQFSEWFAVYNSMDEFFSYRFHLQIRERIILALRSLTSHYVQTNQLDKIKKLYQDPAIRPFFNKPVLENAIIADALRIAMPYERDFFQPWHRELNHKQEEKKANKTALKPVGGFPELALSDIKEAPNSIWNALVGQNEYATFANRFQAIRAYFWEMGYKHPWIPNYGISHLNFLPYKSHHNVYIVNQNLEPNIDIIESIQPGQAIITYSYFGKPLNTEFEKTLAKRDDILWIHDADASLPQNQTSLAPAILYTPSNVVGSPECTILVAKGVKNIQPEKQSINSDIFFEQLKSSVTRFETSYLDATDFMHFKSLEIKQTLPEVAASKLSIEMLKRISIDDIFEKTIKNWQYLYEKLGYPAFGLEKVFAKEGKNIQKCIPLAYPFEIPRRYTEKWPIDVLLTILVNNNIFPHNLYTSVQEDLQIHAKNIINLPCNHKCDKEDLDRMIMVVQSYLSGDFKENDVKLWG